MSMKKLSLISGIFLVVLFMAFCICLKVTPDTPDAEKTDWPLYFDIIMTIWVIVSLILIGPGGVALIAIGLGVSSEFFMWTGTDSD